MSSILKALRKLEEEKAALGGGGVDISRDILKHTARKENNNIFWPLLSVVLFLLLIGFGIFFWSNSRTPTVVLPNETANHPSVNRPIVAIIQPPIKELESESAEKTTMEKNYPVSIPVPVVLAPHKSALPQVKIEPEALHPNGLPFLKLTGIAFRKNASERIAIINDLPIMKGT